MKQTILVTGATDGIGKQTAKELASSDYHLIIHGRTDDRVKSTLDEIKNESGNEDIEGYAANFESLKEVSDFANMLNKTYERLDVLINNAGVFQNKWEKTTDGNEKTFQVNHLAPFLLTNKILGLLENAKNPRIVNVASMVHSTAIDFENLQGEKDFDGNSAYSLSKLCNILFTYKLHRKLEDSSSHINTNCLHPGVIDTKLLRSNWGGIGNSVKEGAENVLYVATYDGIEEVSGKYFVNKMPQSSAMVTYENDKQDKLWEISENMVKDYF
jgi:NAD(P)-dependent dehydrogenase (short-subunit alcohol dehydrogenase family)